MRPKLSNPYVTVGLYLAVAVLSVVAIDRSLLFGADQPALLPTFQIWKGWLFVGLSAVMVGVLTAQQRRARLLGEKLARSEVKASEGRFRTLVQNGSDTITVVGADGEVLFHSPSKEAELAGELPASVDQWGHVHPDDVEALRSDFSLQLQSGSAKAVYRSPQADGSFRWLESVGVDLSHDPTMGALVINTRDVTERHQVEKQLLAEKMFTESIVDGLPGVFYVVDENYQLIRWNRNFAAVLGYDEAELRDSDPFDLFPSDERQRIANAMQQAFSHGNATIEATYVTAAGERLPYALTARRVDTEAGPLLVGTGIDVSQHVKAQAHIEGLNRQLRQRLDHLTALREIDNAIAGSLDLSKVLDMALLQLSEKLEVDGGCVLLYDSSLQRLRFGASVGIAGEAHRRGDLRLGEGLAGKAALTREQVTVTGGERLSRELAPSRDLSNEGFEFYVATPLIAKDELVGVLEVFQREERAHTVEWYDFLTGLAAQAAIALEHANLVESLRSANLELLAAYESTIEGWSLALDLRDKETEGHSQRVTEQTLMLAQRLGVPHEQLVHMRRGALLHDIGKMGVPDSILLKPEPLNDDEWRRMKRHPGFAYQLLQPIAFLRAALDIPYCHHERWDGNGYPQGLKGDEIPFGARIFAVVDVYDALTSDRPYRAAWTREHALSHIAALSGVHFDPQVVEEFMAMIAEGQLALN